jgi:NADH-ubiquinone oxidoreductase chain 3
VFLALFSIFISSFLVLTLKLIRILISEKSILRREELTAFECGFDTHTLSRVPFSLRYFFLTLIFLLFDLEVVLLALSPCFILAQSLHLSLVLISLFLLVLLFGLFYELSDGTLEWVS